MSTIPPSGPSDRIQPVQPVSPTRGAPEKPKDEPARPSLKRSRVALRDDGQVEIRLDHGDVVIVALNEFAARYRELFGEDPPAGSLVNEQV